MTTPAPDCVALDLADVPAPGPARPAHLLVTLHGHPLAVVDVPADARAADGGRDAAVLAAADRLAAHLAADGLAEPGPAPDAGCSLDLPDATGLVSVVICTMGEDPRLVDTVRSVLDQTYPDLEVVVVDNRPATGRTRALLAEVTDPRLRVVAEPCKGLSAARNAGVVHARGALVAFTDDDAVADPDWLRRLVAPFASSPEVMASTGLVLPSELRTPAQQLFEQFGGFDKGFARTTWRRTGGVDAAGPRTEVGALYPYSAGVYGSGNNMAFRASWLRRSRVFDEALGAGSLTKGGEDLHAFLAVVTGGHALVYEPAAVVRHAGRAELDELRAQLFGYGSGNSAAIVRAALAGPRGALAVLRRVPAGLRRLLDPGSAKNARRAQDYPADLSRTELRGFAQGPLLYVRSTLEARRRRRAYPLASPRPPR